MEWIRAHESQSARIDVNSNGITNGWAYVVCEQHIPANIFSLLLLPLFGE